MHIRGLDSAVAFGIFYARLEDLISKNIVRRAYVRRWARKTTVEFGSFSYCMIMLGLDEAVGRKRFLSLPVNVVREMLDQYKEEEMG